jgi:hypothetical protein
MLRTIDIIMILVMVSAAAVTYKIKADSEDELRQVRRLERQIAIEEDSIDLLKADWSLLTQPSRIQRLVDAHQDALGLQATDSHQVTDLSAVPERGLGALEGDPIADAIAADEEVKPVNVAKAAKKKPAAKIAAAEVENSEDAASVEDVISGDDVSTGSVEE